MENYQRRQWEQQNTTGYFQTPTASESKYSKSPQEIQGYVTNLEEDCCYTEPPSVIISPRLAKQNRPRRDQQSLSNSSKSYENPLKPPTCGCGKNDGGVRARAREYDHHRKNFGSSSMKDQCDKELQHLGGPWGSEYKHKYRYPKPSCYRGTVTDLMLRPGWNKSIKPKTPPLFRPTISYFEARLKELEQLLSMNSDEELDFGGHPDPIQEDRRLQSQYNKGAYARSIEMELWDNKQNKKADSPWVQLLPPPCDKKDATSKTRGRKKGNF